MLLLIHRICSLVSQREWRINLEAQSCDHIKFHDRDTSAANGHALELANIFLSAQFPTDAAIGLAQNGTLHASPYLPDTHHMQAQHFRSISTTACRPAMIHVASK